MGQLDEEKTRLRTRLRAARDAVTPENARRLSVQAASRVLALPCYASARRIVAYAATAGEIDPRPIVDAALQAGRAVYFPRLTGRTLEFVRARPEALRDGRYGVPEPTDGELLGPDDTGTLFLVPALAFDERGVRLGRGAGCFDRALPAFPDAVRVGLAFEFQVVPSLPEAPWDVRMDMVVTESRVRAWPRLAEVRA